ncbi:MAG: preprotein translocase subunit YajC [candidate division WOR-3 bacterium]|jgi:preprotein translocase subunit YajC
MINFINLLIAQGCDLASGVAGGEGTPPGACGGEGGFSPIIFMVLIFAVFYFLLIRPSQVQQKKHKAMLESLQKGDRVISSGGIHGKITQIKDTTVKFKVDEKTELEIEKGMIRKVLRKEDQ